MEKDLDSLEDYRSEEIELEKLKTVSTVRLADKPDEAIVELIQNGSDAAYAELVKRYMHKSYSIAYQIVGDYEAARDLSQDVFIKIYNSIHKFKHGGKFFSWYYRILLNHCINYTRRQKVVSLLPFSEAFNTGNDAPDVSAPDRELIDDVAEKRHLVRSAIAKLSSKHRQVVILCELEEIPQEEVAEILGISVGTVRSRLHYARKNLKDILKKIIKE